MTTTPAPQRAFVCMASLCVVAALGLFAVACEPPEEGQDLGSVLQSAVDAETSSASDQGAHPHAIAEACQEALLACVSGSDGSEASFDACVDEHRACMPSPRDAQGGPAQSDQRGERAGMDGAQGGGRGGAGGGPRGGAGMRDGEGMGGPEMGSPPPGPPGGARGGAAGPPRQEGERPEGGRGAMGEGSEVAEEGARRGGGARGPELRPCFEQLRACVVEQGRAPSACADAAQMCFDEAMAAFADQACYEAEQRCAEMGEDACVRVAASCEQGLPPRPPQDGGPQAGPHATRG